MPATSVRSRWCSSSRSLAAFVALGCVYAASCTSDHDSLAARPSGGKGGTSGSGGAGAAGKGGSSPAGGKSNSTGGTGASGGTGGKVTETPGRSVLTLTHGIVDAPRVAWCFARVRAGETRLVGSPTPKQGVAYGGSIVLAELPSTDFERDGVVPFAIAGELALIGDLDCKDAVALAEHEMGLPPDDGQGGSSGAAGAAGEGGASPGGGGGQGGESGAVSGDAGAAGDGLGSKLRLAASSTGGEGGSGGEASGPDLPKPPRLRVGALPALPEGALAEGYSLLLASAGCLGGPAFSDDLERQVCGLGYRPRSATLTAELVVLSRKTAAGSLAFQALHASVASGELSVNVTAPPGEARAVVPIAVGLTEGTLLPRVPRLDLAPSAYGAGSRDWTVQVASASGVLIDEHWPALLAASGLDELENGHGYTLIVIGPFAGMQKAKWWNGGAIALVDNDPEIP